MQNHFPVYFSDEDEEWRQWATENIESLGGSKWKRSSGSTKQLKRLAQTSLNTLSNLSQPDESRETRLERMNEMKKLIVIDAGHGGTDPGAIGITKRKEKDFNLIIALKLRDLLRNSPNFEVRLTRETDVFIELSERARIANSIKADAFVSIHANNTGSATPSGYETWYTRDTSKKFADAMHKSVLPSTGFIDRKVKCGSLAVCRETTMPAILLEAGFLSNPVEEATLFTESWQNKYSAAIYKGICEYFGVTSAPNPSTPDKNTQYPEMAVTIHLDQDKTYTGYSINNITWIPARPIGEMLGGSIGYNNGKVIINGNPVETKLIGSVGHVTARDLSSELGARIFWEKANPTRVEIYPKL
jgi:N-acetylmuramoyl-L-alanine amidase